MKLAIFDLDGTLLPIDAGHQWVHFLGDVCGEDLSREVARQDQFAVEYKEGRFDVAAFMDFHMAILARFARVDLDRWMQRFILDVVTPNVTPAAQALVKEVKDAGFEVVLATGTQAFVSGPIAKLFGINTLLATRPEEDENGEMTGRHVGGYCFPRTKSRRLKAFCKKRAFAWKICRRLFSIPIP
jgi:phosphoserine phosphatase